MKYIRINCEGQFGEGSVIYKTGFMGPLQKFIVKIRACWAIFSGRAVFANCGYTIEDEEL